MGKDNLRVRPFEVDSLGRVERRENSQMQFVVNNVRRTQTQHFSAPLDFRGSNIHNAFSFFRYNKAPSSSIVCTTNRARYFIGLYFSDFYTYISHIQTFQSQLCTARTDRSPIPVSAVTCTFSFFLALTHLLSLSCCSGRDSGLAGAA